jgi:hypothetical protein
VIPMVNAVVAHRVERAVREAYADQLDTNPQVIQNYITAPGKPCWAIVWHEGPDGWAEQFSIDQPDTLATEDVFLEAHDGVLAIFPFSAYTPE